jgi:hypothetical protein
MGISGHMQKSSCEVAGKLHTITFFISSQPEGEIMIKIGGLFKHPM